MSTITVRRIDRRDCRQAAQWRSLLACADGATIFHELDFLAYHGERFDEHHLGFFKGDSLIGAMPMALCETNGARVARSPYGGSFGGPVFRSRLDFSLADEFSRRLIDYVRALGATELIVTPPLPIAYSMPSETFLFALLSQGVVQGMSDLSNVVPLVENLRCSVFTSSVRNMARKAAKEGVTCRFRAPMDDFWQLMELTFGKHDVRPTHDRAQWDWLMKRFPDAIWVDVAYLGDRPVAGIGHVVINRLVDSSFYLCSDPAYRSSQAMSMLVSEALLQAQAQGHRWFDFGTSSIGMKPRHNVFRFKEAFGAIGVLRRSYQLEF